MLARNVQRIFFNDNIMLVWILELSLIPVMPRIKNLIFSTWQKCKIIQIFVFLNYNAVVFIKSSRMINISSNKLFRSIPYTASGLTLKFLNSITISLKEYISSFCITYQQHSLLYLKNNNVILKFIFLRIIHLTPKE